MTPGTSRSASRRASGAALLITLVLVTAVAIVAVSYVAVTRQHAEVSGTRVRAARAELGERAAFEDAANLLASLTASDDYLVTAIADPPPGAAAAPARYTFVTAPGASELTHTPLFAGGVPETVTMPDLNATGTEALVDAAVAAPSVDFGESEVVREIETHGLTHLLADGSTVAEDRFPRTGAIELPADPDRPFRTRYSFWIEDLEGYPNVDVVGAWTDHHAGGDGGLARDPLRLGYGPHDSRTDPDAGGEAGLRLPLRGQPGVQFQFPKIFRGQHLTGQVAPGLSPREIALAPWSTASLPLADHPFHNAAALASRRSSLTGGGVLTGDGRDEGENRFVAGLHPYRRVPQIPHGHGYPDAGAPRHNLNTLVADRDMRLADIIRRNLPNFDERKGGFPPSEDYVATIAANAIDYADDDGMPALLSNTNHYGGSGLFRGVDAYCPVNEFFVKFTYEGYREQGDSWELEFAATLWAEFWNTFNRPVEVSDATLAFAFVDTPKIKVQTSWHDIENGDIVLDEPHDQPFGFDLHPNEIEVVELGEIRWQVEVPKDEDLPSPYPIVSDFRGNSLVNPRAFYALRMKNLPLAVDTRGKLSLVEPFGAEQRGYFFQDEPGIFAPGESFVRVCNGNHRVKGYGFGSHKGSHLGDPWMSYYSASTVDNSSFGASEYRNHASPGLRNFSPHAVSSRDPGEKDLYADQVRVRDWPDRGYENALAVDAQGDFTSGVGKTPDKDGDPPADFGVPTDPRRAPWRLSNLGRYHSVTELGNLHDPVMWVAGPPGAVDSIENQQYDDSRDSHLASLPDDAIPSPLWGGGNTLRIGRREHERFDRPGMRASQLLDLFHTGEAGTNLGAVGDPATLYAHCDPRDHQPPPTAPNPVDSTIQPHSLLYPPELNAQGKFRRVHGHLNLNTAPTAFEIESLLRGPFVASDLFVKQDHRVTPEYGAEGEAGEIRKTLDPDAIPKIARGLLRARPFYSPSHLARVLSELIDRHDALPDHHNDAEAEETFARIANTTTFSSRHFRIFTWAETRHEQTGEVVSRKRRVYEVFLRPERDDSEALTEVRLEILSSRDL